MSTNAIEAPNEGEFSNCTFGDVLSQIREDTALPYWRRKSVATSFRCFHRLTKVDLAHRPLDHSQYRAIVGDFCLKRAGITEARWTNIKTDVNFAFRYMGCSTRTGRLLIPLTQDWQALLDRLDRRRERSVLSRFARFCVTRHIAPGGISGEVVEAYRVWLRTNSSAKQPMRSIRRILLTWNQIVQHDPVLSKNFLRIPDRKLWWTLPISRLPKSFQLQFEEWLSWLAGNKVSGRRVKLRAHNPACLESTRYKIRAATSALIAEGRDPSTITSLSNLVEPRSYKLLLRHIYRRNRSGNTKSAYKVALILRSMARDWLCLNPEILNELDRICRALAPRNIGMTAKNRARLRCFDDDRNVRALLEFPQIQFQEVQRLNRVLRRDAFRVQMALAVETLVMAPMLLGNLASLHLGRNFIWAGSRSRPTVRLILPQFRGLIDDVTEFGLPDESATLLKVYLDKYRPILLNGTNNWLFPGRGDNHKSSKVLGKQIPAALLDATGLHVNVHLFRYIAAKLYLEGNPNGHEVVRRLLAYRSLTSAEMICADSQTAADVRHFDRHVLNLGDAVEASVDRP